MFSQTLFSGGRPSNGFKRTENVFSSQAEEENQLLSDSRETEFKVKTSADIV